MLFFFFVLIVFGLKFQAACHPLERATIPCGGVVPVRVREKQNNNNDKHEAHFTRLASSRANFLSVRARALPPVVVEIDF
jgi:hypothetical protein